MEENFNNMGEFGELKRFYFDLGVEFRQFVIKYNINHKLIKEKTINIFFKQKPFLYLLKEKPEDEPMNYSSDKTPTINSKEEKQLIENGKENKQDEKEEIIDDLKEQLRVNNKNNKKQMIVSNKSWLI